MAPVQSPPARKEESPKTGNEADRTVSSRRNTSPCVAETSSSTGAAVDEDLNSPPIARRLRSSCLRTPAKGVSDTPRKPAPGDTPRTPIVVLEALVGDVSKSGIGSGKITAGERDSKEKMAGKDTNTGGEEVVETETDKNNSKKDVEKKDSVDEEGHELVELSKKGDREDEMEKKVGEEKEKGDEVDEKVVETKKDNMESEENKKVEKENNEVQKENNKVGEENKKVEEENKKVEEESNKVDDEDNTDKEYTVKKEINAVNNESKEENEKNFIDTEDLRKNDGAKEDNNVEMEIDDKEVVGESEMECEDNGVDSDAKRNDDPSTGEELSEVERKKDLAEMSVERLTMRDPGTSFREEEASSLPDTTPKTHELKTPESSKKPRDGSAKSVKRVLNMGPVSSPEMHLRSAAKRDREGAKGESADALAEVLERISEDRSSQPEEEKADHETEKENVHSGKPTPNLLELEGAKSEWSLKGNPGKSGGIIVRPGSSYTPNETKASVVAKFLEPLLAKRGSKEEDSPGRPLAATVRSSVGKKDCSLSQENSVEIAQCEQVKSVGENAETTLKSAPSDADGGKQDDGDAGSEDADMELGSGAEGSAKRLRRTGSPSLYNPKMPISIKCKQQMRTESQMEKKQGCTLESDTSTSKDKSGNVSTGSETESNFDTMMTAAFVEIAGVFGDDSGNSDGPDSVSMAEVVVSKTSVRNVSSVASTNESLNSSAANSSHVQRASDSDREGAMLSGRRIRLKKHLSQFLSERGASSQDVAIADRRQTVNVEETTPTTVKDAPKMTTPDSKSTVSSSGETQLSKSARRQLKRSKREAADVGGEPTPKTPRAEEKVTSTSEGSAKKCDESVSEVTQSSKQKRKKRKRESSGEEREAEDKQSSKAQCVSHTSEISATSAPAAKRKDSLDRSGDSMWLSVDSDEKYDTDESREPSERTKAKKLLTQSAKRRRRKRRLLREKSRSAQKKTTAVREAQTPDGAVIKVEKTKRPEASASVVSMKTKVPSTKSSAAASRKSKEAAGSSLASPLRKKVAAKPQKIQKSPAREAAAVLERVPEDNMLSAFSVCILGKGEQYRRSREAARKKTQKKREQAVQTSPQSQKPLCRKCKCPVTSKGTLSPPTQSQGRRKVRDVAAYSAAVTQQKGVISPWDVSSGMDEEGKVVKTYGSSGRWIVRDFPADRSATQKKNIDVVEAEQPKLKKGREGRADSKRLGKHKTATEQLKRKEEAKKIPVRMSPASDSGKKPMVAVKPMARSPAETSLNARVAESEAESEEMELVMAARDRLSQALTDLFLSAVQNSDDDDDDSDDGWPNMTLYLSDDEPRSQAQAPPRERAQEESSQTASREESRNNTDFEDTEEEDDVSDLLSSLAEEEEEEATTEEEEKEETGDDNKHVSVSTLFGETVSSGGEDNQDYYNGLDTSRNSVSEESDMNEGGERASSEEDIDNISTRALLGDLQDEDDDDDEEWETSLGSGSDYESEDEGEEEEFDIEEEENDTASEKSYIGALLEDIKSDDENVDEDWTETETVLLDSDDDDDDDGDKDEDVGDGDEDENVGDGHMDRNGDRNDDNGDVDSSDFDYNSVDETIDLVDESDESKNDNLPNRTIVLDTTHDDDVREEEEVGSKSEEEKESTPAEASKTKETVDDKSREMSGSREEKFVKNEGRKRKSDNKNDVNAKKKGSDLKYAGRAVRASVEGRGEEEEKETAGKKGKHQEEVTEREKKQKRKEEKKRKSGKFYVSDLTDKLKKRREEKVGEDCEKARPKKGLIVVTDLMAKEKRDNEKASRKGEMIVTNFTVKEKDDVKAKKRKAEEGELQGDEERRKKKKKNVALSASDAAECVADAQVGQVQPAASSGFKVLPPTKSVIFKNLRTDSSKQVRAFIASMLPADKVQSFSIHGPMEVSIALKDGAHKRALELNGVEYKGKTLFARLEKHPPTVASLGMTGALPKVWSYDKWGSKQRTKEAAKSSHAPRAPQTQQAKEAQQAPQPHSQDKKYNVCIDGVPKTIPRARVQSEVQQLLSACEGVGCVNVYNRPQSSFYNVIVDIWGIDSYKKALQVQRPFVEAHHVAIIPIKLKGEPATETPSTATPAGSSASQKIEASPGLQSKGQKRKRQKNKNKKKKRPSQEF